MPSVSPRGRKGRGTSCVHAQGSRPVRPAARRRADPPRRGVEVCSIDRALITALAERLDRRMAFSLSITDRDLYVSIGSDTLTGGVTRYAIT